MGTLQYHFLPRSRPAPRLRPTLTKEKAERCQTGESLCRMGASIALISFLGPGFSGMETMTEIPMRTDPFAEGPSNFSAKFWM